MIGSEPWLGLSEDSWSWLVALLCLGPLNRSVGAKGHGTHNVPLSSGWGDQSSPVGKIPYS